MGVRSPLGIAGREGCYQKEGGWWGKVLRAGWGQAGGDLCASVGSAMQPLPPPPAPYPDLASSALSSLPWGYPQLI